MKKIWVCDCKWEGYFPHYVKREKREGHILRVWADHYCPDCNAKLGPKNLKDVK